MHSKFSVISIVFLSVLLSGCAVEGDIVSANKSESGFKDAFYKGTELTLNENPEGYEEFRVFNQGATGFTPQSAVRRNAMIRAEAFCKKENGGTLRVLTEHRASGAKIMGNWPRVELVFVCVPKNAEVSLSASSQNAKKPGQISDTEKYEKLENIGELRNKGILSEKEFLAEKKKILAQ